MLNRILFYEKVNKFVEEHGIEGIADLIHQLKSEYCDSPTKFTKDDLKPGMVVEFRNGEIGIVLPLCGDLAILSDKGKIEGTITNGWRKNLTIDSIFHNFDINKVYGFNQNEPENFNISKVNRKVLWERKPPKKMTVAEVKKIVEDDIGEEIQVVDRVLNNKIVIMGTEFTDIDKAINYLKSLKLRNSRQIKNSQCDPKYHVGNRFFFESLNDLKNVIGIIASISVDRDWNYIQYGVSFGGKNYVNPNTIMLNEKELDNCGKKINY